MTKRLFFKLFPAFVAIAFLGIVPIIILCSDMISQVYYQNVEQDLRDKAYILHDDLLNVAADHNSPSVHKVKQLAQNVAMRLTVIDMNGKVIYDTNYDYTKMDNHANRREVNDAMKGITSYETRYSDTLKTDMLYFAQPLMRDIKRVGVIRMAVPITALKESVSQMVVKLTYFGILIAIILTLCGTYIAKKFSEPMEKLYRGVKNYANGNFSQKLHIESADEIGGVANAVNSIGEKLQKSVEALAIQNNQAKAILKSMKEGVLAVSTNLKVIKVNASACQMLGLNKSSVEMQNINDALRNPVLVNFIEKIIAEQHFVEQDCFIYGTKETHLHLKGTPLKTDDNRTIIGAVVVMNDVTHLRKLENMRKDFVANVSHELRTPISAMKGAIETLEDGAINDINDAKYFLKMMNKNCNRLSSLIEDILALSRLEDNQDSQSETENWSIASILRDSIETCSNRANSKNITISFDCSDSLEWKVFPSLLQQCITNLIENSIKYSDQNKHISIQASITEQGLKISVQDQGFGIEPAEQERIFERFYRVDKSRSTNIEGTGLGLAIVKHIVNIHHGKIELNSEIAKGSIFSIYIPIPT
ncbi:MAG: ATP-binding protein [Lentisphaeria bacterium]